MLDEQSGERGGGFGVSGGDPDGRGIYNGGFPRGDRRTVGYGDTGGASRFFEVARAVAGALSGPRFLYQSKASRAERNAGLDGLPQRSGGSNAKGYTDDVARGVDRNRAVPNHHPTVKPIDLMRWLCRLVAPPGGTVLDLFAGSGTTGCAAVLEGFEFVGIDEDPEYVEIARARIEHWATVAAEERAQLGLFTAPDAGA